MTLLEACQSAREGNFVTHASFTGEQSMHEYRYKLYYEDGANLSVNGGISFLENQDWAKEGWFIKYSKERVDKEKLKQFHEANKGYMLGNNESYEDCIA